MRLLVGNEELSKRIVDKVGDGKILLFKFGPGSGGDHLLKQFFDAIPEGVNSVWISTHQTDNEMMDELSRSGIEKIPDIISFFNFSDKRIKDIEKRDKFINEGIMVTDLLEISSYSEDRMIDRKPNMQILSAITTTSLKQVLPFRMVIDSLVDLINSSSREDVIDRLILLKKAVRDKGGLALIGCPLNNMDLEDQENSLFDAVIEVKAEKRGENWFRSLTFTNVKGTGEPPEEWEISSSTEIPTALAVD